MDRYGTAALVHPKVQVTAQQFSDAWTKLAVTDEARAADVLLAVGITQRDSAALEWLVAQIKGSVASLNRWLPQHLAHDVESRVIELVAVGELARIRLYSARGPLAGWLQVIVAREAHARAATRAQQSSEDIERAVLEDLEQPSNPAELEALKSRFKGVLGPAMRAAGSRLDGRARALIALHYVDGVSLDDLARAYQVHRATIARWLSAARDGFLEGMRNELSTRVNVPRLEVDSLVRLLQSQVDISLRRIVSSEP